MQKLETENCVCDSLYHSLWLRRVAPWEHYVSKLHNWKQLLVVTNAGSTLSTSMAKAIDKLGVEHGLTKSQDRYVEEWIDSLITMIKSAVEEFQRWVGSLKNEIALLKRTML